MIKNQLSPHIYLQLNYAKAEELNAAVIHTARELVNKTRPNFDNKWDVLVLFFFSNFCLKILCSEMNPAEITIGYSKGNSKTNPNEGIKFICAEGRRAILPDF
jgi:hypothetical protein